MDFHYANRDERINSHRTKIRKKPKRIDNGKLDAIFSITFSPPLPKKKLWGWREREENECWNQVEIHKDLKKKWNDVVALSISLLCHSIVNFPRCNFHSTFKYLISSSTIREGLIVTRRTSVWVLISCVICVGLTVSSVISEDDDVLKAHRCEFACH